MKVINTRPYPDAGPFTKAIERRGAMAIPSPVMEIRFRDEEVRAGPDEALAFTSANGVRAFARLNPLRAMPVFAVGAATADAARQAGFVDVATAGGDVESLTMLIADAKRQFSILHFAGAERAGDLVAALRARGVEARRQVIYDAVPIADMALQAQAALLGEPSNCAVGLFSPRSAQLFLAQAAMAGAMTALSEVRLLALSPAVAAAAEKVRWGAVLIAHQPTLPALAGLIRR